MIDWLTLLHIPCTHDPRDLYHGGTVIYDEDGTVMSDWGRPKPIKGSFDNQIIVRTDEKRAPGTHIEISGNPSKFFQGHNLFGSNDVYALSQAMVLTIITELNLNPSPQELQIIQAGLYNVSRVDITESWALSSRAQVKTAIQALARYAHARNRGRGTLTGDGTVYWGKNSRYWTLKGYCKGDELEAKGHGISPDHPFYKELVAHADKLLRVELCLRGKQLKKECGVKHCVANWREDRIPDYYSSYLARIQIPDSTAIPADSMNGLPKRLKNAYALWEDGRDLRSHYTKSTLYRYRKELLDHGVDILVMQGEVQDEADQDLCLLKPLFKTPPSPIPDWALGTPCFFKPKG